MEEAPEGLTQFDGHVTGDDQSGVASSQSERR